MGNGEGPAGGALKKPTNFEITIKNMRLVKKRVYQPPPLPVKEGEKAVYPKPEFFDEFVLTMPIMILKGEAANEFIEFLNKLRDEQ